MAKYCGNLLIEGHQGVIRISQNCGEDRKFVTVETELMEQFIAVLLDAKASVEATGDYMLSPSTVA
jgi:hypothetical protein